MFRLRRCVVAAAVTGQLLLNSVLFTAPATPPVAASERDGDADSSVVEDAETAARAGVLVLVNHERASRGVAPLVENASLDAAAQSYADLLTNDACFGHACGAQPDFTARDARTGYTPWSWLGENLAAGQPTPEDVVAAWMASELHRENILRPQFTEMGVGVSHGGVHGTYWAGEFGARPD